MYRNKEQIYSYFESKVSLLIVLFISVSLNCQHAEGVLGINQDLQAKVHESQEAINQAMESANESSQKGAESAEAISEVGQEGAAAKIEESGQSIEEIDKSIEEIKHVGQKAMELQSEYQRSLKMAGDDVTEEEKALNQAAIDELEKVIQKGEDSIKELEARKTAFQGVAGSSGKNGEGSIQSRNEALSANDSTASASSTTSKSSDTGSSDSAPTKSISSSDSAPASSSSQATNSAGQDSGPSPSSSFGEASNSQIANLDSSSFDTQTSSAGFGNSGSSSPSSGGFGGDSSSSQGGGSAPSSSSDSAFLDGLTKSSYGLDEKFFEDPSTGSSSSSQSSSSSGSSSSGGSLSASPLVPVGGEVPQTASTSLPQVGAPKPLALVNQVATKPATSTTNLAQIAKPVAPSSEPKTNLSSSFFVGARGSDSSSSTKPRVLTERTAASPIQVSAPAERGLTGSNLLAGISPRSNAQPFTPSFLNDPSLTAQRGLLGESANSSSSRRTGSTSSSDSSREIKTTSTSSASSSSNLQAFLEKHQGLIDQIDSGSQRIAGGGLPQRSLSSMSLPASLSYSPTTRSPASMKPRNLAGNPTVKKSASRKLGLLEDTPMSGFSLAGNGRLYAIEDDRGFLPFDWRPGYATAAGFAFLIFGVGFVFETRRERRQLETLLATTEAQEAKSVHFDEKNQRWVITKRS